MDTDGNTIMADKDALVGQEVMNTGRSTASDDEWYTAFATAVAEWPAQQLQHMRRQADKEARTDAARGATFETNELLEMILVELDTKTLLLSQRVCTAWKSIIARSDLLQQALFFKLAKSDGRRFGIDGANPLLMRHTYVYAYPWMPGMKVPDVDSETHDWHMRPFRPDDLELRIVDVHGPLRNMQFNRKKVIRKTYITLEEDSRGRMYPFQMPYVWYSRGNKGMFERPTLKVMLDDMIGFEGKVLAGVAAAREDGLYCSVHFE